ncbi:hypothetical protein [Micromonospora sp. NPDC049175]|uniref:hypothetical protein n=1 Tax=unclassified Micromonospora TaxID=2617518 RepID=UPI003712CF42
MAWEPPGNSVRGTVRYGVACWWSAALELPRCASVLAVAGAAWTALGRLGALLAVAAVDRALWANVRRVSGTVGDLSEARDGWWGPPERWSGAG